ncbi:hypothetical protein RI129_011567 [Pyrocoelia pectoralis]|uniref:Uncharacterized protein n=1 Tax=Pyrocoelia pectoralis TaxID=417401 RepID=A0AAN7UWL9_9COLE
MKKMTLRFGTTFIRCRNELVDETLIFEGTLKNVTRYCSFSSHIIGSVPTERVAHKSNTKHFTGNHGDDALGGLIANKNDGDNWEVSHAFCLSVSQELRVVPETQYNEPESPNAQYHAHTHQHNVHITTTKTPEYDKKRLMEPLFMAVSSLYGMAVMFVLSIMFLLPKFGVAKSRGVKAASQEEINNFAHIIFRAIEGDDCSDRIVCELGKVAKAFNIHNNRFLKLFRRLFPKAIGWYVNRIEKYSDKNFKCSNITCKGKDNSKGKRYL